MKEKSKDFPKYLKGYGKIKPYKGIKNGCETLEYSIKHKIKINNRRNKMVSMEELLKEVEIKDGMTISFHHHLRNGDYVINYIMKYIDKLGVKDLTVASSGFFPINKEFVDYIEKGTVRKIYTSYINGPVAEAVSKGLLKDPAVLQTHGGRARAIESGELHIDIAFIAASECDCQGNMNGKNGPSAFGVLSYACPDAAYADTVVAVTDNIVPYPAFPIDISQEYVDYIITMDHIGNPSLITSGTTKITENPQNLGIAKTAAEVIQASGYLKDGFTFQTGAGGTSLAVAAFIKEKMIKEGIKGGAILGGTTKYSVELLKMGLFEKILDVQCFDKDAIESIYSNPGHQGMSAGLYANPWNRGAVVNSLDVVVLGATEVDVNFNVNVITNSLGSIMGASGGHSDTAAGAKLSIIVTPLIRKNLPMIRERVTTIATPGETVDVIVTDYGVAVNPKREDLIKRISEYGIQIKSIEQLRAIAEEKTGKVENKINRKRIVAVVQYRDGSIIDVIRKI